MAKIFPPVIDVEKMDSCILEIYVLLRNNLPEDYQVFYNIKIDDYYVDFIIVGPELGIILLKISDFLLEGMIKCDKFELLKKVEICRRSMLKNIPISLIKSTHNKEFHNKSFGLHSGVGAIFTNISYKEYIEGKHNIVRQDFLIFSDDLKYIHNERDESHLIHKLKRMIISNSANDDIEHVPLSQEEMLLIKGILYSGSDLDRIDKKFSNDLNNGMPITKEQKPMIDSSIEHINQNHENPTKGFTTDDNRSTGLKKAIKTAFFMLALNLSIALTIISADLYTKGKISGIKDIPKLYDLIIDTYKHVEIAGNASTENEKQLMPSLSLEVGYNPYGRGTYILIQDGTNYLANKIYSSGHSIEFYPDKRLIIHNDSESSEYNIESDIINIEIGNAYTKIFLGETEQQYIKTFQYDFVNNSISRNN